MANPRKFSEKIALHNQKQAEGTAAFEQIMREVSDATKVSSTPPKETLHISSLGSFRGGSLPNVSARDLAENVSSKTDEQPEDLLPQMQLKEQFDSNAIKSTNKNSVQQQSNAATKQMRESRGRSVGGGPIRSRPMERKMDTSPYSSGPYLSPPPDTSWRRTNSDSALHQSATMNINNIIMQGNTNGASNGTIVSGGAIQISDNRNMLNQRRQTTSNSDSRWNLIASSVPNSRDYAPYMSCSQNDLKQFVDQRPRSSCDVPRVPGINIYPSAQEPGTIQIPIGNNTGSLPDLTSVHFPSPLNAPLDSEHDQSSSPYSSSPVSASPQTLSPTSLSTRQPIARFQFTSNQTGQPLTYNQIMNVKNNHLTVPVNARYLHHINGISVNDNKQKVMVDASSQYGMQNMNMYSRQQHSPPSPTANRQHNISPTPNNNGDFRNPQSRPSPQSTPGIPIDVHSAPGSPATPHSPISTSNDTSNYVLSQSQAALLQQHFEQFSMDWAQLVQSLVESGCTWTAQVQMDNPNVVTSNYNLETSSNIGAPQYTQTTSISSPKMNDICTDTNYYSTSPSGLTYPNVSTSLHTTPTTPTSIPDIILTDFSNPGDDLCRQELAKELGSAITGGLDADLFTTEESLREGLGPLDFDGLQMLTDPDLNVISDNAEDHFRLDCL